MVGFVMPRFAACFKTQSPLDHYRSYTTIRFRWFDALAEVPKPKRERRIPIASETSRECCGCGHSRNEGMTETDPICGMQVDTEQAVGKSEYRHRTYYFCSTGCKRKFDYDPARYGGN